MAWYYVTSYGGRETHERNTLVWLAKNAGRVARRLGVLALVLAVSGCNFKYEPTAAGNPVEEMLISETARHAGAASVKVRGEMTETIAANQHSVSQPDPVAWYAAGVAWFYRPQVAKYVSIDPEPYKETATNIAGHEVCHAVSGSQHDLRHWECMARYATPTYPRPGSAAWTGAAYVRLGVDHGTFELR